MRILIVEDEPALLERLSEGFTQDGHVVDCSSEGTEALYMGQEYPVDAAVVDLGLPGMSGMDVIRELRKAGKDFPILILTARDRWEDKVEGLEAGADDYLAKPFHFEELRARMNALLRRAGGFSTPKLKNGPLELDTAAHRLAMHGEEIKLTTFEYRLMEYLMMNVGKVVSKLELTEHLYPDDAERDSNVLEVMIGRLRRKLDPDRDSQLLETLRGRGYRLKQLADA